MLVNVEKIPTSFYLSPSPKAPITYNHPLNQSVTPKQKDMIPEKTGIIPRKTGYHKNSFFYFQKTSPPLYPGSMLLSSQVSNPQSLCPLCHLRALCVITKLELHTSVKVRNK